MNEAITTPNLTRKRTVLEIVDGKNASFAQVDDDGQPSSCDIGGGVGYVKQRPR